MTEGRALLQKVPGASPHAAEAAFHLARDRARSTRTPGRVRGGGRPLPRHALGRGGAALARQPLPEGRPRRGRRCPGGVASWPSTPRAATSSGPRGARAGPTTAPAATGRPRRRSRRRPGSAPPAGPPRASSTGRPARGSPWARPTARDCCSRRPCSATSTRTTASAPARPSPGSAAARPRPPRSSPPPRRRSPSSRSPTRAAPAQLLLVERLDEAARELRRLPESSRVQATLAWIDWRQGRYRPAITAMKRAYPEWVGEAGDRLPREVWRILFPLRYDAELRRGRAGGGPRPGPRGRAHPPGVDLRPGRFEPRRGARPHAGDAGHRPDDRARQGPALPPRRPPRPRDEPRLRHPLPAPDERPLLGLGREGARRLQRRASPGGRLDGGAGRAPRRGVHREHPLHRDAHLRHDHPRQPRAVPPALRARSAPNRRRPWKERARELPPRRLQAADRPRGAQAREGRARRRPRAPTSCARSASPPAT